MNPWWISLWITAGIGFAWKGEPWLRRHPLAGCAVFAFFTALFAASAALNAAAGAWGWTVPEAALTVLSAYGFWKYRTRLKQAKTATT